MMRMLVASSGFSCGVNASFFFTTNTTHHASQAADTRGSQVHHADMLREGDAEDDVVQLRCDSAFRKLLLEDLEEVGAED